MTIVAVTASAFEHERAAFLEAGFDAMLLKPFRAEEVFEALATHQGVQFAYEEEASKAAPAPVAGRLTPERLGTMPRPWLQELSQALAESDREQALAVAQRMAEHEAALGGDVRALLLAYAFDELDDALKGALAEDPAPASPPGP